METGSKLASENKCKICENNIITGSFGNCFMCKSKEYFKCSSANKKKEQYRKDELSFNCSDCVLKPIANNQVKAITLHDKEEPKNDDKQENSTDEGEHHDKEQ